MRRLLLALCVVTALVPGDGAAAAEDEVRITDDERGALCLQDGIDDECGDPLVRDDRAAIVTRLDQGETVAGIVPAAAATVELRLDSRSITVPTTTPTSYTGRLAGRVKTFTGVLPAGPDDPFGIPTVLVRDAAGALIGVLPGFDALLGESRILLRLRVGGEAFTFGRERRSELRPTILDLGNLQEADCLFADKGRSREGGGCIRPGPPQPVLEITTTCRTRVVYGLLPAGTTATAVLGDGRRVTARTAEPADGWVAFALPSPARVAIRHLELTRAGQTRRVRFGLGPVLGCGQLAALFLGLESAREAPPAPLVEEQRVVLERQGHRLRAGSRSDGRLCLAVDDEPFAVCADPDRGPGGVRAAVRRLPDGSHVVAGVVRAPAPAVRVRVGTIARRVATTEIPDELAGRYAGLVRGFLVVLPAGRTPQSVRALDAAGREPDPSASASVRPPGPEPVTGVRRIARLAPDRVLWRLVGENGTCAVLTGGGRPAPDAPGACARPGVAQAFGVTFDVGCGSRRTVVLAVLRGRRTRMIARTGRRTALESRARPVGGGLYAHRVVLPSASGLRSLTVTRRDGAVAREAVPLPPGRMQCGYTGGVLMSFDTDR